MINGVRNVDPAIQEPDCPPCCTRAPPCPYGSATSIWTHREGARLAAGPLLARSRRQIVTISGPLDIPAGQERLAGFQDAPAQHGLTGPPVAEGQFTQESGEAAMKRLLSEHPDLDGVFAADDLMATGACHVLREHGRRVPEDVAVTGFDDSGAASALSAAAHPGAAAGGGHGRGDGRTAAGPLAVPDRPVRSVILEPELVVRDST
ncbi:substrate-binding domain-containing protein [Streptomyces atroolivaceus]|uniref:Substrate-binding domain-containing protein n=1 Tax=Streptomyces atroolivaceus TaxID=66869 RepID=A0ABV9V6P6_STRAZ|nr:substrate-binding domain-containing protein [Streptomyces atroolivaceus]